MYKLNICPSSLCALFSQTPKPRTPLLCPIQSEDLLLLSQPESRRGGGGGDRSILDCRKVSISPPSSPFARHIEQYSRFSALFSVNAAPSTQLPVLEYLRFPARLQFLLPTLRLLRLPRLALDPLPCPEQLALQIKAASLLRIIDVKQLLEAARHVLHIRLPALRRLDVEDLARLLQRQPGVRVARAAGAAVRLRLRFLVVAGRGGLLVGFGEGAAEDARAGYHDLGDYAMRLLRSGWLVERAFSPGTRGGWGLRWGPLGT